ncbi:MAG TPA: hypothetical protein PK445_10410 [Methanolinea sp.]|jgi:hypothetical protein|nr:hypothetical protein [Methanolinea sp.]HOS83124.1 hypothetical protein [Methanolinea sp.]
MVKNSAQLYTIEGIAAGVLMIVTAYIVVSTSTVLTPQDIHIIDMQLEQLGHDALMVMNTPKDYRISSNLTECISQNNPDWFKSNFTPLVRSRVFLPDDTLHYNVSLYYRDGDVVQKRDFTDDGMPYLGEKTVKVTQWIRMDDGASIPELRNKIVLVEVLLWRS